VKKKTKTVELEELCIDVFAHADCDYEVTLSGNGVNPCEASGMARAILDIIHGDGRKWEREHASLVKARAKELRVCYGGSEEEE
jgi:hypothetical protein